MIQNVDINSKHARATFIVTREKEILFALAIRRNITSSRYRWCFYLGITDEEYSLLVRTYPSDPMISFLGMPSDRISVTEAISSKFLQPSPTKFAGCHFDEDPNGVGWTNPSIIACLESFIEETLGKIQRAQNAIKSPLALVGV